MVARETWVDVARGGAIILVVLFHAVVFPAEVGLAGAWLPLALVLDTFRMPLFFFVAGLFASRALSLPFTELMRSRVAQLVWLYLLWSTIWFLAFQVIPLHDGQSPRAIELALLLVWPNPSTWFVYGLALYFVAAWLLRRWPWWLQLAAAWFVAEVFGTKLVDLDNGAVDKLGMYFLYFLLATKVGPWVRSCAPRVRWWHAALFLGGWGVSMAAAVYLEVLTAPLVRVGVSLLAVAGGSSLAMVLDGSWLGHGLRWLGRNTLPIYLVHFYPVLLTVAVLGPYVAGLQPWGALLPPVLSAVAIAMALTLHRLTRRVPWLWSLPAATSPQVASRAVR